jgi:phospholipid-transporting ATPase
VFAGLGVNWLKKNAEDHTYLDANDSPNFGDFIILIFAFLVAYSHMIPISLYVALEIVKIALAYIISQDLEMYYAVDDKPAKSRTSDLVEELGQVEFVFSDKTGTLT